MRAPAPPRGNECRGTPAPGSRPRGTHQLLLKTGELLIKSNQHMYQSPILKLSPYFLSLLHTATWLPSSKMSKDSSRLILLLSPTTWMPQILWPAPSWWALRLHTSTNETRASGSHCREPVTPPGSQVRGLWCSARKPFPTMAGKEQPHRRRALSLPSQP